MLDEKKANSLEGLIVTRATLASVLGCTGSRVGQLVEAGVISQHGHGRYALVECVRKVVRYQRNGGGERSKAQQRFSQARAEWMEARSAKACLEQAKLVGELVPAEEMARGY